MDALVAEAEGSMSRFMQFLVYWDVGASPSCVTRGLPDAAAIASLSKSGCWVKLVLVCSLYWLLHRRLVVSVRKVL